MANAMTNINDFTAAGVHFSAVKKNRNGGKIVSLSDGTTPTYIILPYLRAPFGVNPPNDQVKDYYLNLSIDDPVIQQKFSELDDRVLSFVADNSVELLGKQISRDVMRDVLFTPSLKLSKDPKYAPTIKVKASLKDGKECAPVYKSDKSLAHIDDVVKGVKVASIIELSQIYFINGKFGISMRLNQAKLEPNNKIVTYAFPDDDVVVDDAESEEFDDDGTAE